MWKIILVFSLCVAQLATGYKILVVSPVAAKSHAILGDGIVRHLLNAGHEVTYVTPYPTKNPPSNLKYVDVSSNIKLFPENVLNIKAFLDSKVEISNLVESFDIVKNVTEGTISNENVQKLLRSDQHFDLAIFEWFFSEVYSGFAAALDCPFAWFSSMEPHWMVLDIMDELPNPSYTPDVQSSHISPLNFWQRAQELVMQMTTYIFKNIYFYHQESVIYEKYFGPAVTAKGRILPPLRDIKYKASLMFGNSHVSLGEATRLPQNYKPIGGYHIDSNLKPLPEDLKIIMESNENGVIYFSMGSNLKSKDLPVQIKKDLLKMFGGLKQTVLWKFEEVMPDLPRNVHVLKWAPQPSILAHPNCILFITHGGLLSTTETIHYGVPIIGIPAFADQFINVGRAVNKGFAKKVDLSYNVAADLQVAIEEMIGDPKYKAKAKELSLIYHDRLATPGAELVHWAEHVIKTKGAPHLRSPALLVPCYQKLYLDLAAVVLGLVCLVYTVSKRLCCGRTKTISAKVSSKKKKN